MNLSNDHLVQVLGQIPNGFKVYLFGSSVYSDQTNDIDLAIVYDNSHIDIREAIEYRKHLRSKLEALTSECDLILLSIDEENEEEFVGNLKVQSL